jgi:23S rRNA (pseudouridine1915-N3)-methyltransferase
LKVDIIAVGRMKSGPEKELCGRYVERFSQTARILGIGPLRIVELVESPARRAEDRKSEEAKGIATHLPEGAYLAALDERGTTFSSQSFAERLGRLRDEGRKQIQFLVGGADGLDPALRRRADLALSFGAMTLPHQLVRILLAEQLYRAASILAGHPYHRE